MTHKQSNHFLAGLAFVISCVAIGALIFFLSASKKDSGRPDHGEAAITEPIDVTSEREASEHEMVTSDELNSEEAEQASVVDELDRPTEGTQSEPDFADYPAKEQFSGVFASPDFKGRDKGLADFQTRIRESLKGPVNFSGRYVVTIFGCGSGGCTTTLITDAKTGKAWRLPLTGEDYPYRMIEFQIDSDLIKTFDPETCRTGAYVWNAGNLQKLYLREDAEGCESA